MPKRPPRRPQPPTARRAGTAATLLFLLAVASLIVTLAFELRGPVAPFEIGVTAALLAAVLIAAWLVGRSLRRMARRADELMALVEAGGVVAATPGLAERLTEAAEALHRALHCEQVQIFLLDRQTGVAILRAATNLSDAQRRAGLDIIKLTPDTLPGQVVESGQAVVNGRRSLGLPIRHGGEVLGVLSLRGVRSRLGMEVGTLQALADQLGLAIHAAHPGTPDTPVVPVEAFEELEAECAELAAFNDALAALLTATAPETLYETTLSEVARLMGAERALLFLAGPDPRLDSAYVERAAVWQDGRLSTADSVRYPNVATPALWQLPLSREGIILNDVAHDERLMSVLRAEYLRRGVGAVAVLPLAADGVWLGTVVVEGPAFYEDQVIQAHRIADVAAAVMDLRLALVRLEAAAERERRVAGITTRLERAPNLSMLLQSAVNQLADALGTDGVYAEIDLSRVSGEAVGQTDDYGRAAVEHTEEARA